MYTPPSASSSVSNSPIRLALIGAPCSGKTYSVVTTFPNVHVFDLDNGLTAFKGREISNTPFWNPEWRAKTYPSIKRLEYAVMDWFVKEASKFDPEQTILFDSYTAFQDLLVKNCMDNAPVSKNNGEKDRRDAWREVGDFHTMIHGRFSELKCGLVVIFHEQIQRTEQGEPTSKIEPVLSGQFKDKYSRFYSDVFRQTAEEDKTTKLVSYKWQVKPDAICNCKTRMQLQAGETKIPATYASLKY